MSTIGERLKEERERLGMTIPALAEVAGAKKNTVIDWQKDLSSPPAAKLAALAEVGIDIQYIVVGVRSSVALATDERVVIDLYRSSSDELKKAVLNVLTGGGQSSKFNTVIHGDVGQRTVVEGNLKQKGLTFNFGKQKK